MSDESVDRLRDLEQRISHWGAEQKHAMQRQRDANQDFKRTLTLSSRVAMFGSIPSVVWIVCWVAMTRFSELISDVPVDIGRHRVLSFTK